MRKTLKGNNQVIVYIARRAVPLQSEGGRLGAHDMAVHGLLPGDVSSFSEGMVEGR